MESESREGRDMSPGGSVKRARQRAAADLARETPLPHSLTSTPPEGTPSYKGTPNGRSPSSSNSSPPKHITNLCGRKSEEGMADGVPGPGRPSQPNDSDPSPQGSAFGAKGTTINPRRARNHWEDGHSSSGISYTNGSRPSTTATGSSTASIPDFPTIPSMPSIPSTPLAPSMPPVPPVPSMPIPTYIPPRRNLGPPPSARRGACSYYSQTSFVPPIPEENSDTHSSYASSHLMPTTWVDGPPEYYTGSGIEEEDEDMSTLGGESGRESPAGDHTEESNLVKKGSPETSFTPYMETLESRDESNNSNGERERELDWQARQDEKWQANGVPSMDPIGRHNFMENGRLQHNPYSGYESDATFLDSPRSPPPHHPFAGTEDASIYFGGPSPPSSPPIDPRVGQILGHLEKGGALASSGTVSPLASNAPSERRSKRPPQLNLHSSKETASRGSANSLPDLIRRATRLASNLDRGKTSSRIGMLDLLNANEKEREKAKAEKTSRPGSLTGILAAFPAPSLTNSTYQKPSTYTSPSPRAKSNLSRSQTVTYSSRTEKPRQRTRRCCGMPMWAFVLVLIIILLLITAAVVIPVTLVVVPRHSGSNAVTVASCEKSDTCNNGGSSIVFNNQCRCICAHGWTGATCTTAPLNDGTCTTTTIPGLGSGSPYYNVTFGNSIPRLLSAAQPNYSIPLNGAYIASSFSSINFSCASENALIAINQKAQRRSIAEAPRDPVALFDANQIPSRASDALTPSNVLKARSSAQTSNEIVFAASGPGGSSSGSEGNTPSTTTDTASASSPTASPSVASGTPITSNVLDFARSMILFIMQERDLDTAKSALDKVQMIFGSGSTYDPTQKSITGNITVNWNTFSVNLGNGTNYGDKGAS